MANSDRIRIQHMLDAAREAVAFARGSDVEALRSDRMRALALTRSIEIIGEAAAAVSQPFRESHTDVPWRVIIATRNRLIHAYFDVDVAVVLETVQNDLPPLIATLEKMTFPTT